MTYLKKINLKWVRPTLKRIIALFGLARQYLKKTNLKWVLTAIFVICAIFGGVPGFLSLMSYFDKSADLVVLHKRPIITSTVGDTGLRSHVLLVLTITNEGEKPLTPKAFDFEYKVGNHWIRFEREVIPEDMTLSGDGLNVDIHEPHEKDLQKYNKPIDYAFPVQGFLLFFSDEVNWEQLQMGDSARLLCEGIFGTIWTEDLEDIGRPISAPGFYPKHGMTITAVKKHPTTNIDLEKVTTYYQYLLTNLFERPEAQDYLRENAESSILFPARIQVLVTTTGTVFLHEGNAKSGDTEISVSSFDMPYQQVMFGENANVGAAAYTIIGSKYFTLNGEAIGQKQVREKYANKIDGIGGHVTFGDRLIDVSADAAVTLLRCFFHFVRDDDYESFYQEYIYINGSTDAEILSLAAADERINVICRYLKGRTKSGS